MPSGNILKEKRRAWKSVHVNIQCNLRQKKSLENEASQIYSLQNSFSLQKGLSIFERAKKGKENGCLVNCASIWELYPNTLLVHREASTLVNHPGNDGLFLRAPKARLFSLHQLAKSLSVTQPERAPFSLC